MSFITENGIKKFNMLCISVLLAILIFASCFAGLYYLYDEFYVKSKIDNEYQEMMIKYPQAFEYCDKKHTTKFTTVRCVILKIS